MTTTTLPLTAPSLIGNRASINSWVALVCQRLGLSNGQERRRKAREFDMHAALVRAERVISAQADKIRALEDIAITDPLTGLINRRGLIGALSREEALARRNPALCGMIVMVDLDGFKLINDTWGHPAGDAYLKAAANKLRAMVRTSDYVARMGGDEFAIVMTNITPEDGHRRVAEIAYAFNRSTVSWKKAVLPMHASFGASSYSSSCKTSAVLDEADRKLYMNKSERRRVAVH